MSEIGGPGWQVVLGDHVEALAVDPRGDLVAAGSLAGDALLIAAHTGETAAKLEDHSFGVLAISWSPDGSTLAVGGQDGAVHLYDVAGDRRASLAVDGWVADLAWSPDGSRLAVASGKRVVLVRSDGTEVVRYDPLASTVTAVAWSPNGRRFGATAYGGITWYDPDAASDPMPKRTFEWKGSILSLAIAPDERWACAGAQDASIHIWPLWSGDDLSMSGYPAKVEHLAFRPDSAWMAAACLGELTVWDFSRRGPAGRRPASADGHERHITAIAWQPSSAEAARLASAGADGRIVVWPSPRRRGETLRPVAVDEHDVGVSALAWSSPRSLVVGRADGTVEHRAVGD